MVDLNVWEFGMVGDVMWCDVSDWWWIIIIYLGIYFFFEVVERKRRIFCIIMMLCGFFDGVVSELYFVCMVVNEREVKVLVGDVYVYLLWVV